MDNFSPDSLSQRLFIGFKPDFNSTMLDAIQLVKTKLSASEIKWVETENLHLTLNFLGDTPHNLLNGVCEAIDSSLHDASKFEITFRSFGTFGKPWPKVVWIGLDNSNELQTIYTNLSAKLEILGFKPDKPVYKPHLTIGRIKYLKHPEILREIIKEYNDKELQTAVVNSIILFESILKPAGPEYSVLKSVKLK